MSAFHRISIKKREVFGEICQNTDDIQEHKWGLLARMIIFTGTQAF